MVPAPGGPAGLMGWVGRETEQETEQETERETEREAAGSGLVWPQGHRCWWAGGIRPLGLDWPGLLGVRGELSGGQGDPSPQGHFLPHLSGSTRTVPFTSLWAGLVMKVPRPGLWPQPCLSGVNLSSAGPSALPQTCVCSQGAWCIPGAGESRAWTGGGSRTLSFLVRSGLS